MATAPQLNEAVLPGEGSTLAASIRSNLIADLIVQASTVVVYLAAVRSPWLIAIWLSRWVVLLGIWAALTLERRARRDAALWMLICAHCFGVLAVAALLPPFSAVAVLVLIGDLNLLVPYASGRQIRGLVVLIVGTATVTGALSLQLWTGFADVPPRWMLITFVTGHMIGTGYALVRSTRLAESALRGQAARLASTRSRTAWAADAAARELGFRLDTGPARVLGGLVGDIEGIRTAVMVGDPVLAQGLAGDAADRAQRCLRELREISHGMFPDVLANGGLRAAVTSLASHGGPDLVLDIDEGRAHPSSENALYGIVVAVLASLRGSPEATFEFSTAKVRDQLAFRLVARHPVTLPDDPLRGAGSAALDRLEAVGGQLVATTAGAAAPGEWSAAGSVPFEIGALDDVQTLRAQLQDESATLAVFLRFSAWFAGIGGVLVAIAYTVVQLPVLLVVVAVLVLVVCCLVLARRALRAGNPGRAAGLLALESSLAALSVTALVPEFLPVTVVIAVLPMIVTPPGVSPAVVRATVVGQTLTALTTTLVGLSGGLATALQGPPLWLVAVLLPPATGGVAALVGTTTSTSISRLDDLVSATQRSLARLVIGADAERRRIERDLHDGAQQGVVALSLQFRALATIIARQLPDRVEPMLVELQRQVLAAEVALDELSRGVFPRRLALGDLPGALAEAGAVAPLAVEVDAPADGLGELPAAVAAGAYFACLEVLQNAVKHAGASARVTIECARRSGVLHVTVIDDGPGFDPRSQRAGRGLANLADRVGALDGRWGLTTAPGAGVRVDIAIPVDVAMPPGIASLPDTALPPVTPAGPVSRSPEPDPVAGRAAADSGP